MKAILQLRWMKMRDDIKLVMFMTVLTFIMIAVFASIDYTPQEVVYGYVDDDQSMISQSLFKSMNALEGYRFDDYELEAAKEAIKDGDISGAFYIPQGFHTEALTGSVSVGRMLITENMSGLQMNSLIQSTLNRVIQDYYLSQTLMDVLATAPEDRPNVQLAIDDSLSEHWTFKRPVTTSEKHLTDQISYDAVKHSVIGFSLFFAMFTIIFGISDILVEKEQNTWQRQLVSPISKLNILSGNLIAVFILGFLQVSAMFVLSKYVFKVEWAGNMLHLVILIAAFVFCVAGLGMMLSNFVNTMGQLSAISPVLITGTAMLGGCFWPLEIVTSKILLGLSVITPQRWAIGAIEKIVVQGYGLGDIKLNIAILVGMGILYLLMGTYFLERQRKYSS